MLRKLRSGLKSPTALLVQLALLLHTCMADYSGTISLSNPQIEASNVDYTFTLAYRSVVPANGKIVIRFPIDFETQFSNPVCTAISGFASTGVINCDYVPSVRLLSLTTGFPTISNPTEI